MLRYSSSMESSPSEGAETTPSPAGGAETNVLISGSNNSDGGLALNNNELLQQILATASQIDNQISERSEQFKLKLQQMIATPETPLDISGGSGSSMALEYTAAAISKRSEQFKLKLQQITATSLGSDGSSSSERVPEYKPTLDEAVARAEESSQPEHKAAGDESIARARQSSRTTPTDEDRHSVEGIWLKERGDMIRELAELRGLNVNNAKPATSNISLQTSPLHARQSPPRVSMMTSPIPQMLAPSPVQRGVQTSLVERPSAREVALDEEVSRLQNELIEMQNALADEQTATQKAAIQTGLQHRSELLEAQAEISQLRQQIAGMAASHETEKAQLLEEWRCEVKRQDEGGEGEMRTLRDELSATKNVAVQQTLAAHTAQQELAKERAEVRRLTAMLTSAASR